MGGANIFPQPNVQGNSFILNLRLTEQLREEGFCSTLWHRRGKKASAGTLILIWVIPTILLQVFLDLCALRNYKSEESNLQVCSHSVSVLFCTYVSFYVYVADFPYLGKGTLIVYEVMMSHVGSLVVPAPLVT